MLFLQSTFIFVALFLELLFWLYVIREACSNKSTR